MAWVTPRTWASNEIVKEQYFNQQIRNNLLVQEVSIAAHAGDLFYASGANAFVALPISVTTLKQAFGPQLSSLPTWGRPYDTNYIGIQDSTQTTHKSSALQLAAPRGTGQLSVIYCLLNIAPSTPAGAATVIEFATSPLSGVDALNQGQTIYGPTMTQDDHLGLFTIPYSATRQLILFHAVSWSAISVDFWSDTGGKTVILDPGCFILRLINTT